MYIHSNFRCSNRDPNSNTQLNIDAGKLFENKNLCHWRKDSKVSYWIRPVEAEDRVTKQGVNPGLNSSSLSWCNLFETANLGRPGHNNIGFRPHTTSHIHVNISNIRCPFQKPQKASSRAPRYGVASQRDKIIRAISSRKRNGTNDKGPLSARYV